MTSGERMKVSQQESSTVAKSISVLRELGSSPEGVSVSDLALRVDMQRASLYRVLRAFENARFVRRDEHKLYHLGYGLTTLAIAAAVPLEEVARPLLQKLANDTSCSAMLLLESGEDVVTALCVTPSTQGLHLFTHPGFVHPRGRNASRLMIEASHPPAESDPEDVRKARARGWASSATESGTRRFGVAAATSLDSLGERGCLLLVTIDPGVNENDLVVPILEAAEQLSARFSF